MNSLQIFNTIQVIAVILASFTHAIMERIALYKVTKFDDPYSFLGSESWKRKYKKHPSSNSQMYLTYPAPNNWYYKFFGIRYKERFPGSATVFVFLTDGYHLVQWFMIKAILIAVVADYNGETFTFNLWRFFALWITWSAVFSLVFKRPDKKVNKLVDY